MTMQFTRPTVPVAGPNSREDILDIKRDSKKRYLMPMFPDNGSKRDYAWTRATTMAKAMTDTFSLNAWGGRMAVKGMALRPDLVALAAATPLSNRERLDSIVDQAKDAAAARASANLGTAMHEFTEQSDRGELADLSVVPEQLRPDLIAYRNELAQNMLTIPAGRSMEQIVACTALAEPWANVPGVGGMYDRLLQDESGQLYIGDLKTGADLTYSDLEISIQLAIYAHADAIWDRFSGEWIQMPAVDQTVAYAIHLPIGKGTCRIYPVPIDIGWEGAQLAHQVRKWRRNGKTLFGMPLDGGRPAANSPADNSNSEYAGEPSASSKKCSVCQQPGHRKGSAKCQGPAADRELVPSQTNGKATLTEISAVPSEPVSEDLGDPFAASRSWDQLIAEAPDKKALSAIRAEAMAAGEWTDELLALGKSRMAMF